MNAACVLVGPIDAWRMLNDGYWVVPPQKDKLKMTEATFTTVEPTIPKEIDNGRDPFPELMACRKVGRILEELEPAQRLHIILWLRVRYTAYQPLE